jgi:uncharacterized phiE125 gp8 family phage protein
MVTLAQIKQALKIDYTEDDQEILRIRDAVVALIENYTGVKLTPQKHTMYLSYWMKTRFEHSPFVSVSSVTYSNASGATTSMSDYFIVRSEAPSVYINFSEFPQLADNTEIAVTYTAGWADLPAHIEQAVIALVGAYYNNPEATAPITLSTVPMSAQFVLDMIREKGLLS